METSPIRYLKHRVGDDLRVGARYDASSHDIKFIRDDLDREATRQRTQNYVEFVREDHPDTIESGGLPFEDYHADVRLFGPANVLHLPLTRKEFALLYSFDADADLNLPGLVRDVEWQVYQRPPPAFR